MLNDRRVLALLLVLVMAGVVVGGLVVVPDLLADDANEPDEDVEQFLAAWSDGDAEAMAEGIVDPPGSFAEDYATLTDGLGIESAEYTVSDVRRDGDVAIAGFDARVRLAGLGEWAYSGSLRLARSSGSDADAGREWLVEWSPRSYHPDLEAGQRLARTREWPERAPITGADGNPLVTAAEGRVVGLVPERIQDLNAVKAALESTLAIPPADVDAALNAPGVQPNFFVPLATVTMEQYTAAEPIIYPIPGTQFEDTTLRAGPTPGYAQHVLGRVGEVTAERLEELGAPYQVGDVVGTTGLEARFERALAGTPSGEVQVLGEDDEVVGSLGRIEGTAPVPVATTIDPAVQAAVETAISGVTKPAAIVVTDPEGNIRGIASRPLTEDLNRALAGTYPPGSTFKIVTAEALLAAGVTPETPVECSETVNAGGRSFRNFEGGALGTVPFGQAFAESCNTAMIRLTEPVEDAGLVEAAERFGFNADYTVGLNTEGGSYPAPEDATEKAAQAIGQGRIVASPLHMATVAGAVVDGSWEPPTLLVDPPPADDEAAAGAGGAGGSGGSATTGTGADGAATTGTTAAGASATTAGATATTAAAGTDGQAAVQPTALDPGRRETLAGLMRRVVTEGSGTAAAAPGRTVYGKTGTAEYGGGNPPPTHAWFVGSSGNLAASVFLEDGGVGGRDAAPIAGALFAALPA